ncbi:MAG: isopenicillin N synthase family oxygenase [Actinobacteria bacterium]|nr:isopenicillin N synthase family oxygenase [Actinomycetota bacterium]NIS30921.1 isopenicillin N synthase family oxygenase [Actinomycetota bacterium]NIT95374.1 isopenicillin N synthase family oxygenase [Actinomycetota bacterium]NIU19053.1 isopenicillin N synthase family oxygenase [Actinomycetota bacterium]NIU66101.1 isopenicillin N synthase family oxygenase [Actinomycetota bacterium]
MSIPVVDLAVPAAEAAAAIDDACRTIGFFAITNHGVPPEVIDGVWAATRVFFDLPLEEKLAARHPDATHPYGFFPQGREALAASLGVATPPDLKESFNLAPPRHHPDGTGRFGGVERIWPVRPTDLRPAWEAYYDAMVDLGARLLELAAHALDLEPGFFDPAFVHHLSALRGLDYPPLDRAPAPGQLRAGEHSDYGTFTILLPGPGDGGLEVQRADGEWVRVAPVPDGFVINVGDMLERWTNDRWRSTRHRVAVPADPTERRQALAFFQQPAWDAEVRVLPTCVEPDEEPRHEAVLAGPWLAGKFEAASGG